VSTSLHTRQITFPVLFTVYHTLQSHTLDLVRLVSSSQKPSSNGLHLPMSNGHSSSSTTPRYNSFDPAVQDQFLRQLAKENNDTHCLLGLNVRNVYGVPFEVTLIRAEEIGEYLFTAIIYFAD
jgi:predicted phosphoadenosine phosphosulfate sulfurtransferase